MFAKHNSLKPNHANAYRVFAQTSLCPAGYLEQSERLAICQGLANSQVSMIQTQVIPNASLGWQTGNLDSAGIESRNRHWRQIAHPIRQLRLGQSVQENECQTAGRDVGPAITRPHHSIPSLR